MKRLNLTIIGIEEGEEAQVKGTENIFNEIIEENFTALPKEGGAYQGTRSMEKPK